MKEINRGIVLMETYKDELQIIFEGGDEVAVDTLITVLDNTVKILKETAQYSIEERYEKFVVRTVERGSFVVNLCGVVATNPSLIQNIPTAITMFKTFLEIKKHLGGKEPTKVTRLENSVNIENNNGNTLNIENFTFNIFTSDSSIDDRLTNITRAIVADDQRSALTIHVENGLSGEKESLYLTKKEAEDISQNVDLTKLNPNRIEETHRMKVRVKTADFEGNSKWQCIVMGKVEYVKISDQEFKNNLEIYHFTKGTILDVDLKISYFLDLDDNEIKNNKREFSIIRVYEVINEEIPDQASLFN